MSQLDTDMNLLVNAARTSPILRDAALRVDQRMRRLNDVAEAATTLSDDIERVDDQLDPLDVKTSKVQHESLTALREELNFLIADGWTHRD